MFIIQKLVTLPAETQVAIGGLVGLLLTLLFALIGKYAPWTLPFLSKWKEELSAALAGVVVGWLSNILPGGVFTDASIFGVNFVVALLVALLSYGTLLFGRMVKAGGARSFFGK